MQSEDGLREEGDPSGRAPEPAKEPPRLQGGQGLLTRARIFAWARFTACWPVERASHRPQHGVRTLPPAVTLVDPAPEVGLGEGVDDAVFTRGRRGRRRARPVRPITAGRRDRRVPARSSRASTYFPE